MDAGDELDCGRIREVKTLTAVVSFRKSADGIWHCPEVSDKTVEQCGQCNKEVMIQHRDGKRIATMTV